MKDTIKVEFREKKLTRNMALVYGFQENKETYDVVFLLERQRKYTYIHGLLSKLSMPQYYHQMWDFLKKAVKTPYIAFEVLPQHYRVYKQFMKVEDEKDLVTFDGYPSKLLIVNKNSRVRK